MIGFLGRAAVAFSLFSSVCISSVLAAEVQDSRDNRAYETYPSGRLNWLASNLANKESATLFRGSIGFYVPKDQANACPAGMHIPKAAEWDSLIVNEFKGPDKEEKMKKFIGKPRGYYNLDKPHDMMGAGSAFFAVGDGGTKAILFDMDHYFSRYMKLSENSAVAVRCVRSKDVLADLGLSKDLKTFTDSRDGRTYKIEVRDSTKVWMKQNLSYNLTSAKQCYMEDTTFCKKYGRYYTYNEALKACPSGWHLPGDGEWRDYQKDREKLDWNNLGIGGCRDWDEYCEASSTGHYWSNSSVVKGTGRAWEFRSKGRSINRTDEDVKKLLYVRCVTEL